MRLAETILQPPLRQAQKRCPCKTLPTPIDSTEPQTSRPTSLLQGTSEPPGTMVPKTWTALAALPGLTPRHYRLGDQIPTLGADSSSCQENRSLLLQESCASFFLSPLPTGGSPRLGLGPKPDEGRQLIRNLGLLGLGQT